MVFFGGYWNVFFVDLIFWGWVGVVLSNVLDIIILVIFFKGFKINLKYVRVLLGKNLGEV